MDRKVPKVQRAHQVHEDRRVKMVRWAPKGRKAPSVRKAQRVHEAQRVHKVPRVKWAQWDRPASLVP